MAKAKKHIQDVFAPKNVLSGAVIGVLLFAVAFAILNAVLPEKNAAVSGKTYGYEYSGAKSACVEFTTSTDAADSVLLFGSSELSTSTKTIPQVPTAVFGQQNLGLDLTYIGEAYDQSLWQAIAVGAYGTATPAEDATPVSTDVSRKIVIIASPTWFEDEGIDDTTFGLRFSYAMYRSFCANPALSDETKASLKERLLAHGVDQTTLDAASRETLVDVCNDMVFNTLNDLQVRDELQSVRSRGMDAKDAATIPSSLQAFDFSALRKQALEDAATSSTNNTWGFDDTFYEKNIAGRLESLQGAITGETFGNETECDDFAFLLDVALEAGFEPLVIISPVSGYYYDYAGTLPADRQNCYARIRTMCEQRNIAVADFSDREYEQYFLHDIVHFGWTGWVDVEEAIYDFVAQ